MALRRQRPLSEWMDCGHSPHQDPRERWIDAVSEWIANPRIAPVSGKLVFMSKITLGSVGTLCAALLLAGCASFNPSSVQVGAEEPAVVKAMGEPVARFSLPGGATRLVYTRGPAGQGNYMVDLGADGRVTSVRQVLSENALAALPAGMTEDELLREIGPPAERQQLGNNRAAWSYRFPTTQCIWHVLTIGPDGRLQGGSTEPDPRCGINRRR